MTSLQSHLVSSLRISLPSQLAQVYFYPPHLRVAYLSLQLFRQELVEIPRKLKAGHHTMGRLRYQWWRGAVEEVFEGRTPKHPIALGLAEAIRVSPTLQREKLYEMIDGFEQHFLTGPVHQSLPAFSRFSTLTMLPLIHLLYSLFHPHPIPPHPSLAHLHMPLALSHRPPIATISSPSLLYDLAWEELSAAQSALKGQNLGEDWVVWASAVPAVEYWKRVKREKKDVKDRNWAWEIGKAWGRHQWNVGGGVLGV